MLLLILIFFRLDQLMRICSPKIWKLGAFNGSYSDTIGSFIQKFHPLVSNRSALSLYSLCYDIAINWLHSLVPRAYVSLCPDTSYMTCEVFDSVL